MADTKISALSSASALAGTEAIPVVQSAATVKTTPAAISTYVLADAALAELIRDTIGTALTQGTGITLTVNDAGNTITIAADSTAVTALTGASAADGTEVAHVVQSSNDRKMTTAQIATYVRSVAVDNTTYSSAMDGVTDKAPSLNVVYDKFEAYQNVPWVSGNWVLFADEQITGNGSTLAGSTIYYSMVRLTRAMTISDMGARVQNTVSGNFKVAIYAASATTGLPSGTPVAETGNISTAAATVATASITGGNKTLPAGFYWSAIWCDNTTATFTSGSGSWAGAEGRLVGSATATDISSTAVAACGLTSGETYGSWPNGTTESYTFITAGRQRNALLHVKIV